MNDTINSTKVISDLRCELLKSTEEVVKLKESIIRKNDLIIELNKCIVKIEKLRHRLIDTSDDLNKMDNLSLFDKQHRQMDLLIDTIHSLDEITTCALAAHDKYESETNNKNKEA